MACDTDAQASMRSGSAMASSSSSSPKKKKLPPTSSRMRFPVAVCLLGMALGVMLACGIHFGIWQQSKSDGASNTQQERKHRFFVQCKEMEPGNGYQDLHSTQASQSEWTADANVRENAHGSSQSDRPEQSSTSKNWQHQRCIEMIQKGFPNIRIQHDFATRKSNAGSKPLSSTLLGSMIVVEADAPEDMEELLSSPNSPIDANGIRMEDPPRYLSSSKPSLLDITNSISQLRSSQQQKQQQQLRMHRRDADNEQTKRENRHLRERNLVTNHRNGTQGGSATTQDNLDLNDAGDAEEWNYNDYLFNSDLDNQHYPYGLEMLRIPRVWKDYNTKGDGITVCVVDTGLDSQHEEFRDLYRSPDLTPTGDGRTNIQDTHQQPRMQGWSPFEYSQSAAFSDTVPAWAQDGNGHGTHVAGILAASDANRIGFVGVAPDINILVVRIFQDNGRFYSSDLVEAFLQCVAFEKEVVVPEDESCEDVNGTDETLSNMEEDTADGNAMPSSSSSSSVVDASSTTSENPKTKIIKVPAVDFINLSLGGPKYQPAEHAIIHCLVHSANIGFLAAAGNTRSTSIDYPAGYNEVLSVAAVDSHGEHAPFSTRNEHVDVTAPGVDIWSTYPSAEDDGTDIMTSGGSSAVPANQTDGHSNTTQDQDDMQPAVSAVSGTPNGIAATATSNDDRCVQCKKAKEKYLSRGYGPSSGTSMALPHVTGIMALAKSVFPDATVPELMTAVRRSTTDLGTHGKDTKYGYGLVDAIRTMEHLKELRSHPSASCDLQEQLDVRLLVFGETELRLDVEWMLDTLDASIPIDQHQPGSIWSTSRSSNAVTSKDSSQSAHNQCLPRGGCYRLSVEGEKVVGYSFKINAVQHAYAFYSHHLASTVIFGDGCPKEMLTRPDLVDPVRLAAEPTAGAGAPTPAPTLPHVSIFNVGSSTQNNDQVSRLLDTCNILDKAKPSDSATFIPQRTSQPSQSPTQAPTTSPASGDSSRWMVVIVAGIGVALGAILLFCCHGCKPKNSPDGDANGRAATAAVASKHCGPKAETSDPLHPTVRTSMATASTFLSKNMDIAKDVQSCESQDEEDTSVKLESKAKP